MKKVTIDYRKTVPLYKFEKGTYYICSAADNVIVFCTETSNNLKGVLIRKGDSSFDEGQYYDGWNSSTFEKFTGTITIEQD